MSGVQAFENDVDKKSSVSLNLNRITYKNDQLEETPGNHQPKGAGMKRAGETSKKHPNPRYYSSYQGKNLKGCDAGVVRKVREGGACPTGHGGAWGGLQT